MAFAHGFGEKLQLPHGAAALAGHTCGGQAAFGPCTLEQLVAQRHDFIADGLQEDGALVAIHRAVAVERIGGFLAGCLDILRRALREAWVHCLARCCLDSVECSLWIDIGHDACPFCLTY